MFIFCLSPMADLPMTVFFSPGQTPDRKKYQYPENISCPLDHPTLLEKYRADCRETEVEQAINLALPLSDSEDDEVMEPTPADTSAVSNSVKMALIGGYTIMI